MIFPLSSSEFYIKIVNVFEVESDGGMGCKNDGQNICIYIQPNINYKVSLLVKLHLSSKMEFRD